MSTASQTKKRRNRVEDAVKEALSRVKVTNAVDLEVVRKLLPLAEQAIGPLASAENVMAVAAHNPDCVWLFSRTDGQPEGFQAFLLLNERGRAELLKGTLNLYAPPIDCLVLQGESPAMIYVWASFTPGILAAGIKLMLDHFASPRYAECDLVSWSATVRGERAMLRDGFQKGLHLDGYDRPDLYLLARSARARKALRPKYDSYDKVHSPTGITVAREISEVMKAAAVRSAVYIGEQKCPYDEEFDGNDFAATHLLAYVDNEPAGCMRIRFFGTFAKLERLAVRREFRSTRTAFELVRASVELCRAKGFRTIYGHARTDLLNFWTSFGFHVRPERGEFAFSGHHFVEMREEIEPANDAISLIDDPYRIIRPEGKWHVPGILEFSSDQLKTDVAPRC